ncbi:MAG: insulinase family protein [Cyclobacteriaceae bacterium]
MKNTISIFILALLTVTVSQAQLDRSQLPEPGTPREIELGDYQSFELKNGLKVFVIENSKLPRVTFRLQIDREPLIEGEKAGYIDMVGQMMRRGTTSRSKEQLDEEIDFIGASVSAGATYLNASGLSKYTEKIAELMTDVLYNPIFPEEELEKIRTQTLSGLAANKEDPNAISSNMISKVVYGKDHPYGEISTEESVANITVEDISSYHAKYFKPNIAYLAVVGDITLKDAKSLVKKYFTNWERGEVVNPSYDAPQAPEKNVVALVNRSASVQSVINVTFPVELKTGHPDVVPVRIMNTILGGGASSRLFMNLREDKGYTYGSYSSLSSNDLVARFSASASVRNEVTDSSVNEILTEIKRMTTESVTDEELTLAKNSIAGSFARSLESPQTVASFAINSAIYNLADDYYSTYLQRVNAVTIDDVQKIAQKYLKPDNAYITIVGKAGDVESGLKQFGEIKYFDVYGEPVDPSKAKLPDGITAQSVLDDYISAIGGKDKLNAIKTMKVVMSASAMGQTMQFVKVHNENKLNLKVMVGGNVMSEQIYDGEKAAATQMGQQLPLNDEQKEAIALEARPFPEIYFDDMGVELALVGLEDVNGKPALIVEATNPGGSSYSLFFDQESKLIVRKASTNEVQGQSMTFNTDFADYVEQDGIKFPSVIKLPLGPGFTAEAKVESVEYNLEVDNSLFEIK